MILILETGGKFCSVALSDHSGSAVAHVRSTEEFTHAEKLPELIRQVLKGAGTGTNELTAVAVNRGPGSYTGLRIGTSFAKGLCYGLGVPLLAVDGLKTMAMSASRSGLEADTYLCMVDARRDEVFLAAYDHHFSLTEPMSPVILLEDYRSDLQGSVTVCGDSGEKFRRIVRASRRFRFYDHAPEALMFCEEAARMLQAGEAADLAYFEPDYGKAFMAGVTKKFAL